MAAEEDHYDDDFEEDDAPPTPTSPPPGSPGSPLNRTPSQNFPWALVTIDDLDMGEQLAAGAMGAVYAGNYRMRPVAIKTLHDVSKNALSSVEAELLVHASLRGPRTVELIAANLVPPKCCIVMERCECSLFEKLHRRPDELSRRQSVSLALQVAEGMNFLHTRRPPVVHRDLKSHNVLLDSNGEAKLCDFGLVGTREPTAGTPNYMAPELFLSKPFGNGVDVFAFGVLLNEIWAREVPWDGFKPLDIKDRVTVGDRPAIPRTMPFACEGLVKKMWHGTAAMRPSFAELIPQLQSIYETLPVQNADSRARGGMDALDALDSLAGLSLKAR